MPASSWQLQTSVLFKNGTEAGVSWQIVVIHGVTLDSQAGVQADSVPVPVRPPILLTLSSLWPGSGQADGSEVYTGLIRQCRQSRLSVHNPSTGHNSQRRLRDSEKPPGKSYFP